MAATSPVAPRREIAMRQNRPLQPGKMILGLGLGLALAPWATMFLLWLWILVRGYLGGGVAWRQTELLQLMAVLLFVAAVILAAEMAVLLVWRLIRRS